MTAPAMTPEMRAAWEAVREWQAAHRHSVAAYGAWDAACNEPGKPRAIEARMRLQDSMARITAAEAALAGLDADALLAAPEPEGEDRTQPSREYLLKQLAMVGISPPQGEQEPWTVTRMEDEPCELGDELEDAIRETATILTGAPLCGEEPEGPLPLSETEAESFRSEVAQRFEQGVADRTLPPAPTPPPDAELEDEKLKRLLASHEKFIVSRQSADLIERRERWQKETNDVLAAIHARVRQLVAEARAEERERCAKVCEVVAQEYKNGGIIDHALRDAQAAIRRAPEGESE